VCERGVVCEYEGCWLGPGISEGRYNPRTHPTRNTIQFIAVDPIHPLHLFQFTGPNLVG
jgi:hypothetical protein